MATDSVRVKPASYLGGIPGQERRNSGNGTLHLGPRSLYVGKAVVLGAAVVGVKYGQVDLDKISSIGIRTMTTPDRVAITVHLKDGSAGSYEVKRQSQQMVLELLQPVATQLGIRISEEAAGAGVLPKSQLRLLAGSSVTYRFDTCPDLIAAASSVALMGHSSVPVTAPPQHWSSRAGSFHLRSDRASHRATPGPGRRQTAVASASPRLLVQHRASFCARARDVRSYRDGPVVPRSRAN
jgi:hypothetical protein